MCAAPCWCAATAASRPCWACAAGRVAGQSIHQLFGRNAQARRIIAETMEALTAGKRFETEIEVVPGAERPALPRKWYALSVRRAGPPGEQIEAIAVLSDITRLKAQQTELEHLARDRELMFSLSEVGIAFVRQGCIQQANEALALLTGRSVDDLLLSPLAVLFSDPEAYHRQWAQEEAALRLHGRWVGERQLRRAGRPPDLGAGQPAPGARRRSPQRHDRRLCQRRRPPPRRAGGGAAGRAHPRHPRLGAGGHRHRRARAASNG